MPDIQCPSCGCIRLYPDGLRWKYSCDDCGSSLGEGKIGELFTQIKELQDRGRAETPPGLVTEALLELLAQFRDPAKARAG